VHAQPEKPRRVLLVDDEPAIATTVQRVLEREYFVVAVTDPFEALRRLSSGESFDVVLCDLGMPGLRGDQLFEETRRCAPEQAARFVFVSGGSTSADVQAFLARVPNPSLEKPFGANELRELLRRRTR
jgi:CheY-like chemotaxis protein